MVATEIKKSLKQSIVELKIAEYELHRPNEDVVTMSVCLTARQSMSKMLRLFLLSKSINHNAGRSLCNLLIQCKKVDKQFESIKLSKVLCNELSQADCENKYCLSNASVTNCIEVANQIKVLVLQKLKLSESELV
ncbi:MAG: hypothetical protein ACYDCN_01765 [Bacteroidia bacterium]